MVKSKNFTAYATETGGGGGVTQITGVTLTKANWSLVSGLYEYTYSNASILSTHSVEVIPLNTSINYVIDAQVLPQTDSSAGSVKMYAKRAPKGDITVVLNLVSV